MCKRRAMRRHGGKKQHVSNHANRRHCPALPERRCTQRDSDRVSHSTHPNSPGRKKRLCAPHPA